MLAEADVVDEVSETTFDVIDTEDSTDCDEALEVVERTTGTEVEDDAVVETSEVDEVVLSRLPIRRNREFEESWGEGSAITPEAQAARPTSTILKTYMMGKSFLVLLFHPVLKSENGRGKGEQMYFAKSMFVKGKEGP